MDELVVVEYSAKLIAIFGPTKDHKTALMALGGKYNPSLTYEGAKTPGWIFTKEHEAEIVDFVEKANSGDIAAAPAVPVIPVKKTIVVNKAKLLAGTKPAMTPEQALSTIAKRSATTGGGAVMQSLRLSAKEEPTTVHFPNSFTAADNKEYRIIMHTVLVPQVDQKFKIGGAETSVILTVKSLNVENEHVVLLVENGGLIDAYIINGKWKVLIDNKFEEIVPL